jgi:hypothetical protein
MPFLMSLVRAQPTIIPPFYASLNRDTAWQIVPGNVLLPWAASGSYSFFVPLVNAGQGFVDAGGRFWLYGVFETFAPDASYGATYDFVNEVAVPQWIVPTTDPRGGGIVSAIDDGGAGLYAVTQDFVLPPDFFPPAAWIVQYPGTGTTASSTTTVHADWAHHFWINDYPTLPRYVLTIVRALWRQGGTIYALAVGDYYSTVGGGANHEFLPSLWATTGDPTDVTTWSFVQYLSHFDLSSDLTYWGSVHEDGLPWLQPVRLGSDVFFTTGMDLIEGASGVPADRTVVWRMASGGTVTSDLAVPMPATGDETWGGPLAVYGGELYWAQFTASSVANWATDTGTITLWRRRAGAWSAISSWTRPLYNTVWHPFIATMVPTATGLWLLFDPADRFFTGSSDPAPTVVTWNAVSNTWSLGASISGGGSNSSPRIWTLPP